MLRLPKPENFLHLRQTPFLVQLFERRVPRLVQLLQGSLAFLLGCRACLRCGTLGPGGVGRFSRRLFSSVGGFPLRVLAGWREFPRDPFGCLPFHLRPLGFGRPVCLLGSLGLLAGLPIAFGLLRGIRSATRSGFPELLHLPEFFASLLRPYDLAYICQPLAGAVGTIEFVRADQFELL